MYFTSDISFLAFFTIFTEFYLEYPFLLFSLHLLTLCVFVLWSTLRGQRTTQRSLFSTSTTWILANWNHPVWWQILLPVEYIWHSYWFFFKFYFYFLLIGVLPWVLGSLQLKLQTVVSCCVGAGNWIRDLCKSSQCPSLLSHLSSPSLLDFF